MTDSSYSASGAESVPRTVIVNKTNKVLDMKVRNHHSFADFITVPQGAKHRMRVDYNDTYHEFLLGVDADGTRLIVTSDDCCDYKCITVTEVDGRFDVDKEPRRRPPAPRTPNRARPATKLHLRRAPVKKFKFLFTRGLMCQ